MATSVRNAPAKFELARVAFTGKLASMTRAEAMNAVLARGGRVVQSVHPTTTMLVVGMDGWPLLADGTISGKLRRAEEMQSKGKPIRIVSEDVFLEIVGERPSETAAPKSYSAQQICEVLHIEQATLQRWEAYGLIRSRDDRFDFQDIVSLRTIAELTSSGIQPSTIARSMRGLASVLPGTDRPLAQLKLISENRASLLAEIEGALVLPDGQVLLDFQPSANESHAALPMAPRGAEAAADAQSCFEHAVALEDEERFDEALLAYRRAVALQPHFPEANFNMANVLLALHREQAAEERFRVAAEQDPTLAAAWYNLASLEEAAGRITDAIVALHRALTACPTYADAHFNLASCYEAIGQRANAAHHWQSYISLDATSEWAQAARRHLAAP